MKIIKVTSLSDNKSVYLNVEAIGHFYTVPEKREYGRLEKVEHTRIGVTTPIIYLFYIVNIRILF